VSRRRARLLLPLVLATIATQASLFTLVPLVVAIGDDFDASVSAVGQARAILSITAVLASLVVGPLIDRIGVRPLVLWGGALGIAGAAASAAAPSLPVFFAAQLLLGAAVACLLSAGFAGVAAYFGEAELPWAMGYVVGAQSIAWIAGNPLIGLLESAFSWRAGYAVPAAACLAALVAAAGSPRGRTGSTDAAGTPSRGIRDVLADRSARSWTIAELTAYAAWAAELTYAGAFYIQTYDLDEATVGLLLAIGPFAFMAATLRTARLTETIPRRSLIVGSGLAMGATLCLFLNVTPAPAFSVAVIIVLAVFAGLRSTGASSLGLDQLPEQAGSMMAARTASAQLGYMIGAVAGGAVLAVSDFGTLGFVLFAGMGFSALLFLRVRDPAPHGRRPRELLPEPVPD
jgi:predicted MFS family arabinose efflux permease